MPERHGPFTIWQWAVLGACFIAIVLSAIVWHLADQAGNSAERANRAAAQANIAARKATATTVRLDKSICAEIQYLERGLTLTKGQPIVHHELEIVLGKLRPLSPGCPPAPPVVFPEDPDLGGTFGNKRDGGGK